MKREKLYDGITGIREEIVERAEQYRFSKRSKKYRWISVIAACLVLVLLGGILGKSLFQTSGAVVLAKYPKAVEVRPSYGYDAGLEEFFSSSMQEFLSGAGNENVAYSPMNLYIALGMLSEITDGNSRGQILELLNAENVKELRKQVETVWKVNYRKDKTHESLLASSLWLNEDVNFKTATLESLADHYYASSYKGKIGSAEMNRSMQKWMNEQTKGLLEDQIKDIQMEEPTDLNVPMLALINTVYFHSQWLDEFLEEYNEKGIFHANTKDVSCEFMKQSGTMMYYWGEHFTAVNKWLEGGYCMWFLLPDEGSTVDTLLEEREAMDLILSGEEWEKSQSMMVHMSIPKFDVSSETDLVDGLKNLGVTDVFDAGISDFSPLTRDSDQVYLSKALHGVRVAIDENGCTAASYVYLEPADGAAPDPGDEIDFVLDRPFLFMVTKDRLPVFSGVVNQP